ncbi:MarR family transcriptional regulator [Lysinibacillus sp. KU-BSD001]|uniref:MarR family winged helix-turn-helix transcriptional regulator n=1 Tax=Lysinibacillus sp. KU-BSD001 TaxID=3141328 RepID=UPI0036F04460
MKNTYIEQINVLQNELIVQLASKYESRLDNQLTAKQVLLLELIQSNVSTTKALAQHLHVSNSAVSQLLNKLEERGYISRNINPDNRREIKLALAQKGEAYFTSAEKLQQEMNERVYGKLSLEDLQQLLMILEKLNTIVQEEYDNEGD